MLSNFIRASAQSSNAGLRGLLIDKNPIGGDGVTYGQHRINPDVGEGIVDIYAPVPFSSSLHWGTSGLFNRSIDVNGWVVGKDPVNGFFAKIVFSEVVELDKVVLFPRGQQDMTPASFELFVNGALVASSGTLTPMTVTNPTSDGLKFVDYPVGSTSMPVFNGYIVDFVALGSKPVGNELLFKFKEQPGQSMIALGEMELFGAVV